MFVDCSTDCSIFNDDNSNHNDKRNTNDTDSGDSDDHNEIRT